MEEQPIVNRIKNIVDEVPFDAVAVANLMDFADENGLGGMSADLDDSLILTDDGRVLLDKPGNPEANPEDVRKIALSSLKEVHLI